MWMKWYDYCLPIRFLTDFTWVWRSEVSLGLGVQNTSKSPFCWCINKFTWNVHAFLFGKFSFLTLILFWKTMKYVFWLTKSTFEISIDAEYSSGREYSGRHVSLFDFFYIPRNSEVVNFACWAFLRLKGGHRSLSNFWNPRKVWVFVLIFRKR